MGSWYGTKIGFKVKPEDEELAQEFLMLLGVNMAGGMDEEIGELNNLGDYSVDGVIEGDLLGIMPALKKKFVDYQNQFYPSDEEDEDVEEDMEEENGFQLDDLYLTAKSLFTRPGMYLAHEDGNSVSDTYYRYEVLYSGVTKTEFNCFYSYGDDINVDTDCPGEEGTEETEEKLKTKKPDSKFVKMLIEKAEAEGLDELVQKLKGEPGKPEAAVLKEKTAGAKKIPGLKTVNGVILQYSGKSKKLEIPDGITEIGEKAFDHNHSLAEIVLPESLVRIGDHAFENCDSLKVINIPGRIRQIGCFAFSFCTRIKEVVIPEGVERIERHAFDCCFSLQKVVLPSTVTEIGNNAFEACSNLESINIPEKTVRIGSKAFSGCKKLTAVVLPDGLKEIDDKAFENCESLTGITIPASVGILGYEIVSRDTVIHIVNLESWLSMKMNIEGKSPLRNGVKLYLNGVLVEDLIIPQGVIQIKENVFRSYEFLKSLSIPASVTEIGSGAFAFCHGLKKAVVPKSLENMISYNRVFYKCEELTDILFV